MFSVQYISNIEDQPAAVHAFSPSPFSRSRNINSIHTVIQQSSRPTKRKPTTQIIPSLSSSFSPNKKYVKRMPGVNKAGTTSVNNNNNTSSSNSSNSNNGPQQPPPQTGNVLRPRFHQTATVIQRDIYLVGGQAAADYSLATGIVFMNGTTLDVSEQTAKMSVTGHGTAHLDGSKILTIFGLSQVAPVVKLADPPVQLFDLKGSTNSSLTVKGQAPPPRYGHTVTVVNQKAFIIGGVTTDPKIITDVSYIDLSNVNSLSWNIVNNTKTGVPIYFGHSTVSVNNFLISCFGQDSKNVVHNDCNVYDTSNSQFVDVKVTGTPPPPRQRTSMVQANQNSSLIIVFGGADPKSNITYNDTYLLDASNLPNLSWSTFDVNPVKNKALVPSPRSGHTALAMDDGQIMMVWGGVSYSSTGLTLADTNTYFLDTTNKVWIDSISAKNILSSGVDNSNSGNGSSLGNNSNPTTNSNNATKKEDSPTAIIIGSVVGVVIILALIGYFIVRKFRSRTKITTDRVTPFDRYIRPGGQLHGGSTTDLTMETNSMEVKDSSSWYTNDAVPLESIKTDKGIIEKQELQQEHASPQQPEPFSWTKPQSTASIESNQLPSQPIPATPLPSTELSATPPNAAAKKKTHRRTSSVSISAADMHRLSNDTGGRISGYSQRSRPNHLSNHRPKSSLSNVINSSDLLPPSSPTTNTTTSRRTSQSSTIRPSSGQDFNCSESVTSTAHSPSSSTSAPKNRGSKSSSRSVNSLQWIGFNNDMLNEKEEKRLSLRVRNVVPSTTVESKNVHLNGVEPPEEGYIIYGEYVETLPEERHSYSGDFLDHDEVVAAYDGQRRSSAPDRYNNSTAEKEIQSISVDDERHGPFVTRQEIHQPLKQETEETDGDPFVSNEEKAEMEQKAKRSSSKRTSRVSFALKDEKIEFDESASSKTVSLARESARSSSQGSVTSPIIEENNEGDFSEDEDGDEDDGDEYDLTDFIMERPASKFDFSRPVTLYEDNEEIGSQNSRLSRFSFSVYDFSTDTPLPENAAAIVAAVSEKEQEKDDATTATEVQEVKQATPERLSYMTPDSPSVRSSIATYLADEGVLLAMQDLE